MEAPTNNQKQYKILIVEDDKFLLDLVSKSLEQGGFIINTATSGESAFRKLAEFRPDIILLDIVLPGIDGFEFLSRIKKDKDFSSVPVIMLSNSEKEEEIERAKNLGADDFMVKVNFTTEEIVSRVKDVLSKKYF